MTGIASECMILNLQVGLWMGYRLDKEASAQVTEAAGAESDAARVNKHLIPKEALKPIQQAGSSIRTHFYAETLPWKDNGDRLLTRRSFERFIQKHEALATSFNLEVDQFLEKAYPSTIAQAAFRMGELFDIDDYPSAESLRRRFYVHLDIDPVATAGDFRVDMDSAKLEEIRADITAATERRIATAMRDVWTRLYDRVEHYTAKISSDTEIFRNSTVSKLEEIVDILPELNIMNDPQLEQLRLRIKDKLIGIEPKDLRTDPVVRSVAADEARAILQDMGSFMKAMAGT